MDSTQFDTLVKSFSSTDTRRALLRRLAPLPLAGLLATLLPDESEAGGRRKRRKTRNTRHSGDDKDNRKGKRKGKRKGTNRRTPASDRVAPPPAGCTPTTCAAQGTTCGSIPDGCGKTLDCGPCADGQRCADGACACDGGSCPDGCCEGISCRAGTTLTHCKGPGVACEVCGTDELCGSATCGCMPDPASCLAANVECDGPGQPPCDACCGSGTVVCAPNQRCCYGGLPRDVCGTDRPCAEPEYQDCQCNRCCMRSGRRPDAFGGGNCSFCCTGECVPGSSPLICA